MQEVPYKCSIDALVFLSLYDKAEREQRNKRQEITLENILSDVCEVFEQDVEKVKGRYGGNEITTCKRLFYFLAREKTEYSSKYIGRFMHADHSTVLVHAQTVRNCLRLREPKWGIIWRKYLSKSRLFNANDF